VLHQEMKQIGARVNFAKINNIGARVNLHVSANEYASQFMLFVSYPSHSGQNRRSIPE